MKETFTRDDVGRLIEQLMTTQNAWIAYQATDRPFSVNKITLDLSVARPREQALKVPSMFRSFFVEFATDVNTSARMILGANESIQQDLPLVLNASMTLDYPINEAYIFWEPQPGKKLVIDLFVNAEYRSGSQVSVNAGGFAVNEGASVSGPNREVGS